MAARFIFPYETALDSNGDPGAGWMLYFYASDTTTPQDTFSDEDLTVANTNPVYADSAGRFPNIFLQELDYKVILKTEEGTTVSTADPVRSTEAKSSEVISITTDYTATLSDDGKTIEADATMGTITVTLPPAATAGNGFELTVKKIDSSANAVTVDADGSESIDGGASVTLPNQFDVVSLLCNGTSWLEIVQPLSLDNIPLPLDYLTGLELSINDVNPATDLDTAPGQARDDTNTANMDLPNTLTKQLNNAWAVGDGNGGLDTGSVAADSVYYQHLIKRSDTGVVDVIFSLSDTSPTMPSGYDLKRAVGGFAATDDTASIAYVRNRDSDPEQLAKAWVNFNGATAAIRDSYNVSGVVRNAVGDWTITFNAPLPDANYTWSWGSNNSADDTGNAAMVFITRTTYQTAESLRIIGKSFSGGGTVANADASLITITINGG